MKKHLPDKEYKTDEELLEPDAEIVPIGARVAPIGTISSLLLSLEKIM